MAVILVSYGIFRSYPQLVATFDEYEAIADKDITASIKSELSGDLEKGMLAIGQVIALSVFL